MTPRRPHHGATLPLVVVTLTAALGAAALTIDLGLMAAGHQRAQAVADAAALAGATQLPDADQAASAARSVAAANQAGGELPLPITVTSPLAVTVGDGSQRTPDAGGALEVRASATVPTAFGGAVGFRPEVEVGAKADVLCETACGLPSGTGIAPFGVIGDDPNGSDVTARYVAALLSSALTPRAKTYQPVKTFLGQTITLRQNVWGTSGTLAVTGNFDPVALDTNYQASIFHRAASPLAVGQTLSVVPSATVLLTRNGLNARLASSNLDFTHRYNLTPTYTHWFFGDPAYPIDGSKSAVIDSATQASYSYTTDPHRQELTEGRVLLLPIIRQSTPGGTGPVTVMALGAFFVEQVFPVSTAGSAIANGRFIGLTVPGATGGVCTNAGNTTPARLRA